MIYPWNELHKDRETRYYMACNILWSFTFVVQSISMWNMKQNVPTSCWSLEEWIIAGLRSNGRSFHSHMISFTIMQTRILISVTLVQLGVVFAHTGSQLISKPTKLGLDSINHICHQHRNFLRPFVHSRCTMSTGHVGTDNLDRMHWMWHVRRWFRA